MGFRDSLLQSLPMALPVNLYFSYSLLCHVCSEFVRFLACLLQKSCSEPRAPLCALCVCSAGGADKAPLRCGSAETSTVLRLVSSWSWETRAGV